MLILSVILLLLGGMLICAEVFIPGFGICGISGIALIIASSVITVVTIPLGIFIVLAELVMLVFMILGIFQFLKKRQLHGRLILDETLAQDQKEYGDLSYFTGKEGLTKTPLRPFGTVDFNGIIMEVSSDGGYVSENRKVRVIETSSQKIVVKQVEIQ